METNLQNTKRQAAHYSHYYAKAAWIYQYGADCFGFRFGPLDKNEAGVFVGCCLGADEITEQQAVAFNSRTMSCLA